jgi:hypothetical protein
MKAERGSSGIDLFFLQPRRLKLVCEHRRVMDHFAPGEETRYPLCRRLGGFPGCSGRVRKISPPPAFDPRTVQLVSSGYTDRTSCGFPIYCTDRPRLSVQGDTVFKIPSFNPRRECLLRIVKSVVQTSVRGPAVVTVISVVLPTFYMRVRGRWSDFVCNQARRLSPTVPKLK